MISKPLNLTNTHIHIHNNTHTNIQRDILQSIWNLSRKKRQTVGKKKEENNANNNSVNEYLLLAIWLPLFVYINSQSISQTDKKHCSKKEILRHCAIDTCFGQSLKVTKHMTKWWCSFGGAKLWVTKWQEKTEYSMSGSWKCQFSCLVYCRELDQFVEQSFSMLKTKKMNRQTNK